MTDLALAVDPEAEYRRWEHRHEQMLDQTPGLLQHLREITIPAGAADSTRPRVSGGGGPAAAPLRLDPAEDADDVWAALVEYTVEVAERLQVTPPPAVHAAWTIEDGIRGLPARLTPSDVHTAAWGVVAWLVDHAARTWPLDLHDTETYLYGLIRRLLARYLIPPVDRPARRRVCTTCGEPAVVVDWMIGDRGHVSCRACGQTYNLEGTPQS